MHQRHSKLKRTRLLSVFSVLYVLRQTSVYPSEAGCNWHQISVVDNSGRDRDSIAVSTSSTTLSTMSALSMISIICCLLGGSLHEMPTLASGVMETALTQHASSLWQAETLWLRKKP